VHDTHHANTQELGAEQGEQLLAIVGVDGSRDRLGLLGAAHGRRLNILDHGSVPLLVDLQLDVIVDAEDDGVGEDVNAADEVENDGVFEGDPLRQLHHKAGVISILSGFGQAMRDETYRMIRRFELSNLRGQFLFLRYAAFCKKIGARTPRDSS